MTIRIIKTTTMLMIIIILAMIKMAMTYQSTKHFVRNTTQAPPINSTPILVVLQNFRSQVLATKKRYIFL